ncbi:phage holin family protein [Rosenbergiella sp. S61]|uniref:Phage holin family protein n=1 Tax=Rosenbergiella gaditana TaxID=2726987 RepID=A0ABS5SYH3_9GAMM|nr:phage holin family protein [Rosenbergiella gaditana]MBT0725139.1 phage holin family protein [Rosenbergiella gaditana]
MPINDYPAMVNAILSLLIVLAISFYRRGDANHRPYISWLAWLVVVIYGNVPIRYLVGLYHHTHWAIVLVNLIVCVTVFRVRGNLARIVDLRI